MRLFVPVVVAMACCCISVLAAAEDEPLTLIEKITKWQYPGSTFHGANMSDAATMDANGNRTVPSTLCKTTLTTADSPDKVIAFYRELLKRDPNTDDKLGTDAQEGRSVTITDESEGRPFSFHTILVNTDKTSTTLIVTRGEEEKETRITWKHYSRHTIGE